MNNKELLLTSSQLSQQFSACLWDYNTKNVLKLYKNGGSIPPKTLDVIEQSYILSAEIAKPLLHVWPLNSQEIDKSIKLILPGPATCLSICPKNTYLAVAIDTKLYIWQISSGKLVTVQQRHYQPITCVKFSSDSEYVVVSGEDGILVVYLLADLIAIYHSLLSQSSIGQVEPKYIKNDHSMPITHIDLGVFGRNSRIATCSVDRTSCLYSLSTGELLLKLVFHTPLTTILIDMPCWRLYVGSNSGHIRYYNLKNPPRTLTQYVQKREDYDFIGHKDKIVALALNLQNNILASGSLDNFVYTWDVFSKQILHKFEHKSAVTNVKFVANYSNFFEQNFKVGIIVKPLERNIDQDSDDFIISTIQNEDIQLSDDESSTEKELLRKQCEEENTNLRIINTQLYRAAISISKKYNNINNKD
ncbi:WD repeat-containing protein 18 [Rhynchophorus ferrugineus]|uniref:WD repeat-containing protein 18 n=1 Tax=Rhynchophorus ferrugineus TaxID=354439 RepID=UPI003FCC7A2F